VDSYRTEEEQVEALKRWWKENGRSVVLGVVLAVGLGVGWQAWQKSRDVAAENASVAFQQMLALLAAEEETGAGPARELAQRLKDEHRGSTYAQFAALHLARLAVQEEDLATAEQELRWVLAMADEGSDLHRVARLRLARVLGATGDLSAALDLLSVQGEAYAASYALARGDLLLGDGREAEALAAYRQAADALGAEASLPPGLSEKLEYLQARGTANAEAG